MHLYLAFLLHRDYFHRPDASLSSSFVPQGLFPPVGFIPSLLFCSTGIILLRSDASLSSSFASQGLFLPVGFIPTFLFCPTGIISAARIHPQLALLFHRDYFDRPDASLPSSFVPQGLFCPVRMHLYLPLLLHRDYFHRPNASLSSSFVPQGLFCPVRMHLYLPLLLHRDYFRQSDSSLPSSFVTQGLFPPAGCIPSLLFSSTRIISTVRMHLYLPLLLHRDYFCRPDSSPACSFLPQGLFPLAECISNPGSCKVSATKLLLHRKHSYGFC